jgi:hypothetical protein
MPEAILGCEIGESVCCYLEGGKWVLILESDLIETPEQCSTFLFGDLCV